MLKKNIIVLIFLFISSIFPNSLKGEEKDFSIGYQVGLPILFGIFLEAKIESDISLGVSGVYVPAESEEKSDDVTYGAKFYVLNNIFKDDSASFYTQLFIGYLKFGRKYRFFGGGLGAGFKYHYSKNLLYLFIDFSIDFGKDINKYLFVISPGVALGLGFNF